jgi:hypothetical protein
MEYYYLGLEAQYKTHNHFPTIEDARVAAIHAAQQLGYSVRVFLMDEFKNSMLVERVAPGQQVDEDFLRYKGL